MPYSPAESKRGGDEDKERVEATTDAMTSVRISIHLIFDFAAANDLVILRPCLAAGGVTGTCGVGNAGARRVRGIRTCVDHAVAVSRAELVVTDLAHLLGIIQCVLVPSIGRRFSSSRALTQRSPLAIRSLKNSSGTSVAPGPAVLTTVVRMAMDSAALVIVVANLGRSLRSSGRAGRAGPTKVEQCPTSRSNRSYRVVSYTRCRPPSRYRSSASRRT